MPEMLPPFDDMQLAAEKKRFFGFQKMTAYRLVQAYRPKFLESLMPTPFLRDRPRNFAYVFNVPLPSPVRMLFFFFYSPDIWVFVCVFWIFDLGF